MVSPTTPESPIDLRKRWRNGGPESSAGSIKGIASTLLKIGPASTSSSSTLIPACDKEIPHLPPELWLVIFRHLSPGSLAKSRCVARIWRDLSDEPALWKKFCLARGLDSELYVLKPVSSDTSGSPHVSDLSALETQDFLLAIGDWEAELELGMREHEDVITPTETESEPSLPNITSTDDPIDWKATFINYYRRERMRARRCWADHECAANAGTSAADPTCGAAQRTVRRIVPVPLVPCEQCETEKRFMRALGFLTERPQSAEQIWNAVSSSYPARDGSPLSSSPTTPSSRSLLHMSSPVSGASIILHTLTSGCELAFDFKDFLPRLQIVHEASRDMGTTTRSTSSLAPTANAGRRVSYVSPNSAIPLLRGPTSWTEGIILPYLSIIEQEREDEGLLRGVLRLPAG